MAARAGARGAPPRNATRWRIPKEVEICGDIWSVVICPPWSDSGVVGDCDVARRKIRISDALAPSATIEVFMHELLHAMLAAAGALYGIDADTEERIVYPLAPVLLDTFRRNRFRFG